MMVNQCVNKCSKIFIINTKFYVIKTGIIERILVLWRQSEW